MNSFVKKVMAKQSGPIKLIGCVGETVYYKMNGEYYARKKSSLDKKVITNPAFAATMQNAKLLGVASRIASIAYRQIPRDERDHKTFRELTGREIRRLKEG